VASRTMWTGGRRARRRSGHPGAPPRLLGRPLDAPAATPGGTCASAKSGILDVGIRHTGHMREMSIPGVYRMNRRFSSFMPDPHMVY